MSKPVALHESRRRLSPGEVFGGVYRFVSVLHEGHHGLVVEAEQIRLGRRVALKMLGTHFASDVAAHKRLNKEVELLSQLEHPHIVRVLDFNQTQSGEPYLVMELLQGESLSKSLAPGQTLEIPRALTIGTHVASALTAAHSKGVCHRSLNPRHIYVTESCGSPFARVFGFSITLPAVGGQSGEHALVSSTRNLGYIAPEQRKPGGLHTDELCDQYSLAVLIYHMLTGSVPEVRGGVMSLLRRGQASITPPSAYRSGIPVALDRVLLRGLSQDPSRRYLKVSDFAAALLEAGRNYLRRSSRPTESSISGMRAPSAVSASSVSASSASASSASSISRYAAPPAVAPPAAEPSSAEPSQGLPSPSIPSGQGSSRRVSRAPSSLTGELAELEELIRAARSAPNLVDAVDAALRALQKGENTMSTQIERRLSDHHRLFEQILQRYLGGTSSKLEVHAPSGHDAVLTPVRAFLLSRIDGVTTSAELVQLTPLPRLETLAHLAALMRAGMIRPRG